MSSNPTQPDRQAASAVTPPSPERLGEEKLSQLLEQIYQEQGRRHENEERMDHGPQVEPDIEPTPQARRLNLVHMSDEKLSEYADRVFLAWEEARPGLISDEMQRKMGEDRRRRGEEFDQLIEGREKRKGRRAQERVMRVLDDEDPQTVRAIANGSERPTRALLKVVSGRLTDSETKTDRAQRVAREYCEKRGYNRQPAGQRTVPDGGEADHFIGSRPAVPVSRSTTARQSNPGVDVLVTTAVGLGLLALLSS
jgi:hypothetical protein